MSDDVERWLASVRERDWARTHGEWQVQEHDDPPTTAVASAGGAWLLWVDHASTRDAGDDRANVAFAAACSADVPRLLALVDRQAGWLDDVWKCGEGEMAARWERAAVVGLIREYMGWVEALPADRGAAPAWMKGMGEGAGLTNYGIMRVLKDAVEARGDTPQDAPDPSACRREIDRLRCALRAISDLPAYPDAQGPKPDHLPDAHRIAREALGGEDASC